VIGEISEMYLEGFLDEETGEMIDGTSPGYPRRQSDPNCYIALQARSKRPRTIPCPGCNRKFNSVDAMAWHRKAKGH